MKAIEKLLRVTPVWVTLIEIIFNLVLLTLSLSSAENLTLYAVKWILNLAFFNILIAALATHYQIRHTPYLLILDTTPRKLILSHFCLTFARAGFLLGSLGPIADVSSLVVLMKNIGVALYFSFFVSFTFSLNSKIQFQATKNGKLNLNYIIQAIIFITLFTLSIFGMNAKSLWWLNLITFTFIAIVNYIVVQAIQSLRIFPYFHRKAVQSYFLTFLITWCGFYILSLWRIPTSSNPVEISFWQGIHFSPAGRSFNLDYAYDYINGHEVSCDVFFPDELVTECHAKLKEKFLKTQYPNTQHPEFLSLIQTDKDVINKYAYFFLQNLTLPTKLSSLWFDWVIEEADPKKIAELAKKQDAVAATIINYIVMATPYRPEITQYFGPDLIVLADLQQVQKTLNYFYNDSKKTYPTIYDVWKAWNSISKLPPAQRRPANVEAP